MLPLRTILHPTDFSENSQAALQIACALARDYRVRLILLHVAVPPTPLIPEGALGLDIDLFEKDCRAKIDEIEPTEPGIYPERMVVVENNPVEAILRTARTEPCDLIVMGTHGRSGFGHLLMGSVAENVMRKAPCPVLTVRPNASRFPAAPARTPGHEARTPTPV